MIYLATAVLVILQLCLPRRWAFAPLIAAGLHLGNTELFIQLTPCRLVILVGLLRAIMTGRQPCSTRCPLDLAFIAFSVTALAVSVFPREDVASPIRQNLGLVLNVSGSYFYGRSYLTDPEGVRRFAVALCIIMIPLAAALTYEQATRQNLYEELGGSRGTAAVRNERVRAQGPFGHSILAGTAGATMIPIACILWRSRRRLALLGLGSGLAVTVASASSGPLAALGAGLGAMWLWKTRRRLKAVQILAMTLLILGHLVSNRGVWYLMARMDLVGGSTGYHRAKLIDNALADFSSWWLRGTDYTRDWMWSGVTWSDRHTDITNYYIHLGVIGGAGLLAGLVAMLWTGFRMIGREFSFSPQAFGDDSAPDTEQPGGCGHESRDADEQDFVLWCLGSAIFAHAVTFVSISYFDQMYALFYLILALVPGATLRRGWDSSGVVSEEQQVLSTTDGTACSPAR